MPRTRSSLRSLSALGAVLFLAGCEASSATQIAPVPRPAFDLDLFEQNLVQGIGASADGYVWVISQNGSQVRSGAVGMARRGGDELLPHHVDKPMMIFSLSKVITTVAALQLLERRGLTPEAPIAPWLPPDWPLGPGVDEITFRELLTHTSGLSSDQIFSINVQGWNAMRDSLEVGVTRPKTPNYLNLNFALFQVLIPSLWRGLEDGPGEEHPLSEEFVSLWYRNYVNQNVLAPTGVPSRDCVYDDRNTATLFYAHQQVGAGWMPQDRTLWCSSDGWYLSAMDLARFMAGLTHSDVLLTPAQRSAMDGEMLGWGGLAPWAGQYGSYRGKSGGSSQTADGTSRGGQSYVMKYPGTGVEVVLFINSRAPNEPESMGQFLTDAYDSAWVASGGSGTEELGEEGPAPSL
jgi:D-alanyl-D-alanine carboxypeptidase